MTNFDWGAVGDFFTNVRLLQGAWTTVWLAAVCMAIGFVLAIPLALWRDVPAAVLRAPATFYIWLFRGTPLLVQIILIYTGLPQVGIRFGVTTSVILALSLNEAAYQAEIIRAGLRSVPKGQWEAARALGMKSPVMMARIIGPQTLRLILLPMGNNFNALLKATSLASVISMQELLQRSESLGQFTFKILEVLFVASIYYLAMTTLWGLVQRWLEKVVNRHVVAVQPDAPVKELEVAAA